MEGAIWSVWGIHIPNIFPIQRGAGRAGARNWISQVSHRNGFSVSKRWPFFDHFDWPFRWGSKQHRSKDQWIRGARNSLWCHDVYSLWTWSHGHGNRRCTPWFTIVIFCIIYVHCLPESRENLRLQMNQNSRWLEPSWGHLSIIEVNRPLEHIATTHFRNLPFKARPRGWTWT